MSQIIVPDRISKRGKDIEEHLSSGYLEPWIQKLEDQRSINLLR